MVGAPHEGWGVLLHPDVTRTYPETAPGRARCLGGGPVFWEPGEGCSIWGALGVPSAVPWGLAKSLGEPLYLSPARHLRTRVFLAWVENVLVVPASLQCRRAVAALWSTWALYTKGCIFSLSCSQRQWSRIER